MTGKDCYTARFSDCPHQGPWYLAAPPHHPTLAAEGLGLEELFGGPRHVQVFQWKLWHLGLAGEDTYLGRSERRRGFTAGAGETIKVAKSCGMWQKAAWSADTPVWLCL